MPPRPSQPSPSLTLLDADSPAVTRVDRHLEAVLDRLARGLAPADLVVAFSGGPDSTVLLWALGRLAHRRGLAPPVAVHVDHRLDPGSRERAGRAGRIAACLGAPFELVVRDVPAAARPGESLEAAARRQRYRALEEVRRARRGRRILTAHHRDDQAETVLLRLLAGSGIEGLAAIREARGRLLRPLLQLPREALSEAVEAGRSLGLPPPVRDPANRDPRFARTMVRHRLLPLLEGSTPAPARPPVETLASVAAAAAGARRALSRRLEAVLDPADEPGGGASISRRAFEALPAPLAPPALALLHRRAGLPYPPGRDSREELLSQLAGHGRGGERVGCDCAPGWRWQADRERLWLLPGAGVEPFAVTLRAPGTVLLPELGLEVQLALEAPASWMASRVGRVGSGALDRSGPTAGPDGLRIALDLPLAPGDRVVIRSRRPGDRLHPVGSPGRRKLKQVLIDHRVPRHRRDRLPLLCLPGDATAGETIAWVPGVTLEEAFRLSPEAAAGSSPVWVARVRPAGAPPPEP